MFLRGGWVDVADVGDKIAMLAAQLAALQAQVASQRNVPRAGVGGESGSRAEYAC